MSFALYARPLPVDRPEPESFYALKFALAKRLGISYGLRSDPLPLRKEMFANWLAGVQDSAARDIADEATRLLELLEQNPQGVEIWIGEADDY